MLNSPSPQPQYLQIASAIDTTCAISFTSCTLTTSAPPCTAAATVAAVPQILSLGVGTPVTLPIKLFRLDPTTHGSPCKPGPPLSSSRCLSTSTFCLPTWANPNQGSSTIRHGRTPAASAART